MFSQPEKASYPPFEILDPVYDAVGLSDAQKARASVAVGYALAIAAQGHGGPTKKFYEGVVSDDRIDVGSKWLQTRLMDMRIDNGVTTQVVEKFEDFCAKSLALYKSQLRG